MRQAVAGYMQYEPGEGIAHGKQFNSVASVNLFKFVQSQLTDYAKQEYSGKPEDCDARKRENHYLSCAGILQRKLKLT
jgi:hypothetical protein